jgi:hypothetical protein
MYQEDKDKSVGRATNLSLRDTFLLFRRYLSLIVNDYRCCMSQPAIDEE